MKQDPLQIVVGAVVLISIATLFALILDAHRLAAVLAPVVPLLFIAALFVAARQRKQLRNVEERRRRVERAIEIDEALVAAHPDLPLVLDLGGASLPDPLADLRRALDEI